jgi:hypothetical protein
LRSVAICDRAMIGVMVYTFARIGFFMETDE